MDTMKLPAKPDYLAPDGSEIRLLVATPRGSMAHCRLPRKAVTKSVWHRSVEEIWYCVSGRGELWRQYGSTESVTSLEPGMSVLIGFQERFQFRALDEDLELLLATIPGWPGPDEAVDNARSKWTPTVAN
jgi:mannose-6-phosphate isomerase-like protein (cupin superfamily)